jgi:ferric-dicitrate binding protein FerR (iron transport regulator)
MSPADRRIEEVRRMLDGAHGPLPDDLASRAARRGHRMLRRRRALVAAAWTLAACALAALALWAAAAAPWDGPARTTTPPVSTW